MIAFRSNYRAVIVYFDCRSRPMRILPFAILLSMTACADIEPPQTRAPSQPPRAEDPAPNPPDLKRTERAQYKELVSAFVEHCVRSSSTPAPATAYFHVERDSQYCSLRANTYFDDDTIIVDILATALSGVDPRFNGPQGGLLGATWKFGEGRGWSKRDGTPLVSLGRQSASGLLGLFRLGPSL